MGKELQTNDGNILFENFYQGSKVFKQLKPQEQYASRFHHGKPEHLWFKSTMTDVLCCKDGIDIDMDMGKYMIWRDSVWGCKDPIRYPNGRGQVPEFSLLIDSNA